MATKKTDANKVAELPDGPADATGLTPRQQRVLAHIKDSIEKRGYPPSMREIGEAVGLTSSSSVAHQLKVLEEKGYVRRDPNRPRALEVFLPEVMAARRSISSADEATIDETGIGDAMPPATYVPMLGRIAAGGPIEAYQDASETLAVPDILAPAGDAYVLRVRGDSMIEAHIADGDFVVIRQQDDDRSAVIFHQTPLAASSAR